MSSPTPTTRLDKLAQIITGIFLGGFAIAGIALLLVAQRASGM